MDAFRREGLEERVRALGQHRVQHADEAGDRHSDRQHEGSARARTRPRPAEQRAAQPGERRREVDGAQRCRGSERVVSRNLADGEQGDANGQVTPQSDAEREQHRCGRPLDVERPRDHPSRRPAASQTAANRTRELEA
jgi:hypothetical protein